MRRINIQRLLRTIVELVPVFLLYDVALLILLGSSTRERTMGWQEVSLYCNSIYLAAALPSVWWFLEIAAVAVTFWLGVAIVAARIIAPRCPVSAFDLALLLALALASALVVVAFGT